MRALIKFFALRKQLKSIAHTLNMGYFNYHAKAKALILAGKLKGYYFTKQQNGISPALVLVFDDKTHPIMPIREYRWIEYVDLLPKRLLITRKDGK